MSMYLLTILQFIGISAAYMAVVLFLPWLFLHKKMTRFSIPERIMGYFLAGNFYIIYLVFLMQFLHISGRITLLAGTALPFVWRFLRRDRGKISRYLEQFFLNMQYTLRGELGLKSLLFQIASNTVGKWCAGKGKRKKIIQYLPDILLTAAVVAGILYVYGSAMFYQYGYKASDIPVHNYWINMMCQNYIFGKGVYPYGFHCMIYYLHTVFGIKTYILLRVFALVQTVFIHLMLLIVLKGMCKARFVPYLGTAAYLMLNIYPISTYQRYASTLPQEYGMLFIFPAAYFAIRFFQVYAARLKAEKQKQAEAASETTTGSEENDSCMDAATDAGEKEKIAALIGTENGCWPDEHTDVAAETEQKWTVWQRIRQLCLAIVRKIKGWMKKTDPYLWGFIISFSLTLTVHFYNTMVAGVFCVAIAVGFFFRFLRWKYFRRVVTAALLGILISVIPMGIGVAMGRGLEGSLIWGMKVINGTADSDDSTDQESQKTVIKDKDGNEIVVVGTVDEETIKQIQEGTIGNAGSTGIAQDGNMGTDGTANAEGGSSISEGSGQEASSIHHKTGSFVTAVKEKGRIILGQLLEYIVQGSYQKQAIYGILAGIAGLFVLGLISMFFRRVDYGGLLWSVGCFGVLMCVMQSMHALGLPQLMDPARNSIFFTYAIGLIWAMDVDAVIYLIFGWMKRSWAIQIVSLAVLLLAGREAVTHDLIKEPLQTTPLETNGAITCLTNIMRDEKDHTWTILSANDEFRMVEEYGYHYEMITFLREIKDPEKKELTIPTKNVYFFIEKKPVNYASTANALEGTPVSEEYAAQPIPSDSGIYCYQGTHRWITMSHMYYWAQKMQTLYPNEMQVYYETDDFICYRLQQNSYSLYDLSIDYGYNDPKSGQTQE